MAAMPESSPVGRWRNLKAIRIDIGNRYCRLIINGFLKVNVNDVLSYNTPFGQL